MVIRIKMPENREANESRRLIFCINEDLHCMHVQDLQRVTCEKLELASHVSSLQLELERGREELHHTRDQMDRLQQVNRGREGNCYLLFNYINIKTF
jgi:hypothetical protein